MIIAFFRAPAIVDDGESFLKVGDDSANDDELSDGDGVLRVSTESQRRDKSIGLSKQSLVFIYVWFIFLFKLIFWIRAIKSIFLREFTWSNNKTGRLNFRLQNEQKKKQLFMLDDVYLCGIHNDFKYTTDQQSLTDFTDTPNAFWQCLCA